ncbi:MAG: hypothetical protein ETSY1_45760 [Candidatus Entotheonella factor]|uniref:Protein kinase domain-containing protein n=1 Tax=Entotheonella factor TaxID=1429438 RepID=W4L3T7_ENTF1|nr:MAG: hypothetical protein ETSY1_45760 [Candidatus Entotheonella factor]
MADRFLDAHPGLRPYVLSNLQLTGTVIGGGAYGSVEEVTVPLCGAAKRVHDLLVNSSKISTQFAEELQLMSTLHHPNIVQFLGVYFFPGSRCPLSSWSGCSLAFTIYWTLKQTTPSLLPPSLHRYLSSS